MVQLSLPANSRVATGKTWPKHGDSKTHTEFKTTPNIRASTLISSIAAIAARWFSMR
jgi:hypothetical protein